MASQVLDILHSDGSDSVVLCDPVTYDDVAEVFHNERHTVTQTVEQALATARLFANAERMRSALLNLLVVAGTPITERQQAIITEAREAAKAAGSE